MRGYIFHMRACSPLLYDIVTCSGQVAPSRDDAAFGTEATIQPLLDAGANLKAKDMHGDSPLSWASWYLRPDTILRLLCYDNFHIHPNRLTMAGYLLGKPQL